MLSRVADSLYWMSRYLERAEHTARLLDVNLHQMLDQKQASGDQRWDRVLASLRAPGPSNGSRDAYTMTRYLTFDLVCHESISACIGLARENARQVREKISSEMWEQLNRLYLQIRSTNINQVWGSNLHEFFRSVKEGAHLFQGITDATLSHGEGWQFIQVGRYIERVSATASLLDVYFSAYLTTQQDGGSPVSYMEWVSLLKSCTAFEAYCKVYTAEMKPEAIAEFLLLNNEFPRSIRFCTDSVQASLQAIAQTNGARHVGRIERLAGRLRAALDYGQVDEIMRDMHPYLEQIRQQCGEIHAEIYQVYIAYPVDTAIVVSSTQLSS